MKDTSAAILSQYLEQENVKYLLGIPGGHILPIYDAMNRTPSIHQY
jgi:thiamine pyrophosphate-dependent acetolactate synthase large subunit-like protein